MMNYKEQMVDIKIFSKRNLGLQKTSNPLLIVDFKRI